MKKVEGREERRKDKNKIKERKVNIKKIGKIGRHDGEQKEREEGRQENKKEFNEGGKIEEKKIGRKGGKKRKIHRFNTILKCSFYIFKGKEGKEESKHLIKKGNK